MIRLFTVIFFVYSSLVCLGKDDGAVRIDFNNAMYSKLNEEEKSLLQEYSKAYLRVKLFYQNIRLDVVAKEYRNIIDKKTEGNAVPTTTWQLVAEKKYELRCNTPSVSGTALPRGEYSRVDLEYVFFFDPNRNEQRLYQNFGKNIFIVTPAKVYKLSKLDHDRQYYALNLTRNLDKYLREFGFDILQFDTAAYGFNGMFLEDICFRFPSFIEEEVSYFVDSVKETQENGLNFVEIQSHAELIPSHHSSVWKIKLLRETWVVKETYFLGQTLAGAKLWQRLVCSYDGEKNRIPLLKGLKVSRGGFIPDQSNVASKDLIKEAKSGEEIYDITNIVPGAVPLEEFDVKQFLPPEAGDIGVGIASATFPIWRIACIVLGIILLITGVGLQIWKTRQSKNRTE